MPLDSVRRGRRITALWVGHRQRRELSNDLFGLRLFVWVWVYMSSNVIGIDIDVYSGFCCHIQHTMFGGSVWLYEAVLLVFALYLRSYLVLMYYVLYHVLSYWYLLCSRKANFYVIHRQFFLMYSVFWFAFQIKHLHEKTFKRVFKSLFLWRSFVYK